jgi:hypothetical protein
MIAVAEPVKIDIPIPPYLNHQINKKISAQSFQNHSFAALYVNHVDNS